MGGHSCWQFAGEVPYSKRFKRDRIDLDGGVAFLKGEQFLAMPDLMRICDAIGL